MADKAKPDYVGSLPLMPGAQDSGEPFEAFIAPTGGEYRVPRSMAALAAVRGYKPLSGEYVAQEQRRHEIIDEQAGFLPALRLGMEKALGAATFGGTDWLLRQATKRLGGVTDAEYDDLRRARELGSPTAAAVGEAVGIALPVVATMGIGGAVEGGAAAVRGGAGLLAATPVGLVTRAGAAVTQGLERAGAARAAAFLGEGASVTEAGALAIEAGTRAAQASRAARVVATTLSSVAPRAVGGAIEGVLWGSGEAMREQFNGSPQTLAESWLAHVGTDALLFAGMNGTLGVLEQALPAALEGARALVSTAYERAPLFGRRSLVEAAVKAPERTGVAAETARILYSERDALVQLDSRLSGALDQLATAAPERVQQVLANVDGVVALAAGQRKPSSVLSAIVSAPAEQASAVLEALPGVSELMSTSRTALPDLLATPVEQLGVVLGHADVVAQMERQVPGAMRSLLAAPPEAAAAAVRGWEGVLSLESVSPNALRRLLSAPPDRAAVALENAGTLYELENIRRGTLDAILEAPAERAVAALSNPAGLMELERIVKDSTRQILGAEAGAAEALLANAREVAGLELQSRGILGRLLDVEPERAALFARNAEGLRAMDRARRGTVRDLVDNATMEEAEFFAGNSRMIAEFEANAPGAIDVLRESSAEQGQWFLSRAADISAMEKQLPGSMPTFRAFVTGPEGVWSRAEADYLLDNWRAIMRNPNERARIAADFMETKQAQFEAGERLAREAYAAAKGDREAMLRAVGEPGGPPSLERVQTSLAGLTDDFSAAVAEMKADSLKFSSPLVNELEALAQQAREAFTLPKAAEELAAARAAEAASGRTALEQVAKPAPAAPRVQLSEYLADPAKGFERLADLRSELGELVRTLRAKPQKLLSEKRVYAEADRLYKEISGVLKSTEIWGEAAASRAAIDAVVAKWHALTNPKGVLRKKFMEIGTNAKGEAVPQFAESKFNQYINQVGDARTTAKVNAGRSKTQALHEMTSVLDEMVNVVTTSVPSVVRGAVDIGEADLRALVNKATTAHIDVERRALVSRIYNQTRLNMAESIPNTLGFRRGSVNLGGYGHGVPTAGTTGATVAPMPRVGTYAEAMAEREAGLSVAAAERQTATELESIQARERLQQQQLREAELGRRSSIVTGEQAVGSMEAEAMAASALPGADSFFNAVTQRAVDLVPGGNAAVGAFQWLTAIPRAQWQVTSRVRGMVSIEKRAAALRQTIDDGARKLLSASRKVAPLAVVPASGRELGVSASPRARAAEERAAMADQMRRAKELAMDQEVMADHVARQSALVAGDLPDFTEAVGIKAAEAAAVLGEAVPEIPEAQLDAWEPSAAETAEFQRRKGALNNPTGLLERAGNGTLTASEVRAVERVFPEVMEQMRVAVQSALSEAQASRQVIPRQRVQGIETLLGYRLTSASTQVAMAKAQEVFGGARQGESAKSDTVQPLPGASRLTLANRSATSLQASEGASA